MNPRVREVEPLENHKLLLTFTNDERRIFDVEPLINERKRFKELENQFFSTSSNQRMNS